MRRNNPPDLKSMLGGLLIALLLMLPVAAGAADGAVAPESGTALGLLAFNSPYIFGAAARHDGITCDGCHSPAGLHGKATTLSFKKKPVSILAMRDGRSGMVLARHRAPKVLRHIIVDEFEARDADRMIVAGLTDLLARDPAVLRRMLTRYRGPTALLRLAVARIAIDVATNADTRIVGFEILTARFLCAALADRPARSAQARDWNRQLAEADADILGGRKDDAVARLRDLNERIVASR